MAFSSAQLSTRLYTRIEAKFGRLPKAAREPFKRFTDALAEGLVQFLQEDTQIQVTMTSPGGTDAAGQPVPPTTSTGTGKFV